MTLAQIQELAIYERLMILADGSDELDLPKTREEIENIRKKVGQAHENMTKLNGVETIVGLMSNDLVKNSKLFICGRNNSIENIYKLMFVKDVPKKAISLGEEEELELPMEVIPQASNFRILPFIKTDLKLVSHNLLCQDDQLCEKEEEARCTRAYNMTADLVDDVPIILIPALGRWTIEVCDSRIQSGITDGASLSNISVIICEMVMGRIREHTGLQMTTDIPLVNFSSLQRDTQTREVLKCVQQTSQVCFKSLQDGDIVIPAKYLYAKGELMIEAKGIQLSAEIVRKMGLLNLENGIYPSLTAEPTHLSVMEHFYATELNKLPLKPLENALLSVSTERQLAIAKLLSGLNSEENTIVSDYVSMMGESSNCKEDRVLKLCKIFLRQPKDKLPETGNYEGVVINGKVLSSKHLGLVAMILEEAQRKLTFHEFQDALSVVSSGTTNEGNYSRITMTCDDKVWSVDIKLDENGDTYFIPSTWATVLFMRSNLIDPIKLKITKKINKLRCMDSPPDHVNRRAIAEIMAQSKCTIMEEYVEDLYDLVQV